MCIYVVYIKVILIYIIIHLRFRRMGQATVLTSVFIIYIGGICQDDMATEKWYVMPVRSNEQASQRLASSFFATGSKRLRLTPATYGYLIALT